MRQRKILTTDGEPAVGAGVEHYVTRRPHAALAEHALSAA
jgi:hypothetical protein